MIQTQLYIYKAFKAFAEAHQDIERIVFEFEEQLDNLVSSNQEYPILFVAPLPNPYLGKGLVNYGFRIYCLDIIQRDDRSNIHNLINKTELILRDFVTFFHRDGEAPIYLENEPTTIPVNNFSVDYCVGHYVDVVIQSRDSFACGIPFKGQPVFVDPNGGIIIKEFLTCEDLANCDVFTEAIDNLQEQIDDIPTNLSGFINDENFISCDDLSGCTTIQNINSNFNNYLPLTGGTLTGDLIVGGDFEVLGTTTTINTQTLQALDNNIELNFGGTHLSANLGGLTIIDGISTGNHSIFKINSDGDWFTNQRLGVGTNEPDVQFHVLGDAYVGMKNTNAALRVGWNMQNHVHFGFASSPFIQGVDNNLTNGGPLVINPNGGNVAIGYPNNYVQTRQLDVNGDIGFATDGNGNNGLWIRRNSGNNWTFGSNGVGNVMQIQGNLVRIPQSFEVQRTGITINATLGSLLPTSPVFRVLDLGNTEVANITLDGTIKGRGLDLRGFTDGITFGEMSPQNAQARIYTDSSDSLFIESAQGVGKNVSINGLIFRSTGLLWNFTNATGAKLNINFSPSGWAGGTTPSIANFRGTVGFSSGNWEWFKITPRVQQSGTAAFTDLLVNREEVSTGSGTQRLLDLQVNDDTKFNVNTEGEVFQKVERWTFDFMDALDITIYADDNYSIDEIDNIVGTPTITIEVNDNPYTLGDPISLGDKVYIESDINSVIKIKLVK